MTERKCDTEALSPNKHTGPIKQGHIVHDKQAAKDAQHWLGFTDDAKDPHERSDGMFGGDTSRALNDKIRQFQEDNNLTSNGEINKGTLDAMKASPDEATRKAGQALEKMEKDKTLSRVYNPKVFEAEGCGKTEDLTMRPVAKPTEKKQPPGDIITGGTPVTPATPAITTPAPKGDTTNFFGEGWVTAQAPVTGDKDKGCPVLERTDEAHWNALSDVQRDAITAARDCMARNTEGYKSNVYIIGDDYPNALSITAKNPKRILESVGSSI